MPNYSKSLCFTYNACIPWGIRKRYLGRGDSEKWLENTVLKGPNQKPWAKQERLLCEGACNETTGRRGEL